MNNRPWAYYNEYNPQAAAWLRELIRRDLIAPGEVDERSIVDVAVDDLSGFCQHHFFAGIGGWSLALRKAGWADDIPVITGSPPCFEAGTLVQTNKSLVCISNIKPGDIVLTHMGRWRRVLRVGGSFKEIVRLKGQGASFGINTTENHPFLSDTRTGKGLSGNREWTPAKDMKGRFWASVVSRESLEVPFFNGTAEGVYETGNGEWACRGDRNGKSVTYGTYPTRDAAKIERLRLIREGILDVRGANGFDVQSIHAARFLGYWLGDGWASKSRVYVCGNKAHWTMVEDICTGFGINFYGHRERTVIKYEVGSTSLASWLTENFGIGARNKQIPPWVMTMSREWRMNFLRGYLEADGNVEFGDGCSTKLHATTVSKALALGIRTLASTLGYIPSISWKQTSNDIIEGRPVKTAGGFFRVSWVAEAAFERTYGFNEGDLLWGKVRGVEYTGRMAMTYNLEVEEDNSYTADGIVVHNCQPFSVAGRQLGKDDERHLAPHFAHLIGGVRPPFVFGEQVATKEVFGPLTTKPELYPETEPEWAWIDDLSSRLEGSSYAVAASDIPASGLNYPHPRQRTFFGAAQLADCDDQGLQGRDRDEERGLELSARARGVVGRLSLKRTDTIAVREAEWIKCRDDLWRQVEPSVCGMAHGLSDDLVRSGHIVPAHYPLTIAVKGDQRNMRIHGYGNAIVPDVAAMFILSFMESVKKAESGLDAP